MIQSENLTGVRPLQDGPEPDSNRAAHGNAEAGIGVSEDAGREEKDGAEEEVEPRHSSITSEKLRASGFRSPRGKATITIDRCAPGGSPYSIDEPSRRNDIATAPSSPTTLISPASSIELIMARISRVKNEPKKTVKRSGVCSSRHLLKTKSASRDSINCVPPEVHTFIQAIYNGLTESIPSQSTSCK